MDETEDPKTAEEKPKPALSVARDKLTFVAGDRAASLPLLSLIRAGERGATGLLLYGVILKLSDIDASLRRLVGIAEGQAQRVEVSRTEIPDAIDRAFAHLRELGFPVPAPPARRGDGAERVQTESESQT